MTNLTLKNAHAYNEQIPVINIKFVFSFFTNYILPILIINVQFKLYNRKLNEFTKYRVN